MNIENEYYQAKAAKEDNPQAAIAGFERVRPLVLVHVCTENRHSHICSSPHTHTHTHTHGQ